MAIPISQLVCVGMALVTIGYSVGLAIHLFRQKNKTFNIAFDDTVGRLRTLSALAIKLQQSEGKERKAACRQAAGLVREDCRTLFYLVNNFALERPPKDERIHQLSIAASSEVRQVYLMTYWIFLLLRFRPSLLKELPQGHGSYVASRPCLACLSPAAPRPIPGRIGTHGRAGIKISNPVVGHSKWSVKRKKNACFSH